jgi:opacity protein-like surface antigen
MSRGSFVRCKVALLVLATVLVWVFFNDVQLGRAAGLAEQSTYEVGLRYGYGQTCKASETIHFSSLLPRWGVFLTQPDNPLLGKLRLSFIVEGIFGTLRASHTGWDLGITPLLKISYPLGSRVLGYIEGGAGVIWENIDSPTYAYSFNFSPQVGAGIDIRIVGNYALSMAYRYRHTSNAGLFSENPDVNANFFMIGLCYYY